MYIWLYVKKLHQNTKVICLSEVWDTVEKITLKVKSWDNSSTNENCLVKSVQWGYKKPDFLYI